MKKQSWAMLGLDVLGVILSRAVFAGMNPIALGFFGAAYLMKTGRWITFLAVGVGLVGILPLVEVGKYVGIMVVTMVIVALLEKKSKQVGPVLMGGLLGVITTIVACSSAYLEQQMGQHLLMGVIEGVITFAFVVLFYQGIRWYVNGFGTRVPSNEDMISIALLIGFTIYAMEGIPVAGSYVSVGMAFFLTMFFGYRYGAGFGTVMGAVCGIALAALQGQYLMVAIMCLFGLLTGVVRELGRILTGISVGAAIFCAATLYPEYFTGVDWMRCLAAAVVVFLLMPSKLMKKMDFSVEGDKDSLEEYTKSNIQNLTKTKLKEFSEAFYQLSNTFEEITKKKVAAGKNQMAEIMEDVNSQICSECTKRDICWKNNYPDTYQDCEGILHLIQEQGYVDKNDLPQGFLKRCIRVNSFLNESRRLFETSQLNLSWQSRLAENREAIAGQLSEVASIIDEFSNDLYRASDQSAVLEVHIRALLKSHHIVVRQLVILEKKNKRQLVYLIAKAQKGLCITTKEVASLLGEAIGRPMRPMDSTKNVITKEYDSFGFSEDTIFKVLTGTARMTKLGEKISGDNFSVLNLESGEAILSLSDGMGTGINANEESESVIELLEQFMEAGFREESAIRLINSILVLKSENQSFSTIDLSIVNLYSGVCEFVKIGASASFIKRDHWVETIASTTMPVGVFNQVDFDQKSKKLYDGDFVIMMTDGVLDCIKGNEKEKFIQDVLMEEGQNNNPQEMANRILRAALDQNDGVPIDDMTVLVAGVWKK